MKKPVYMSDVYAFVFLTLGLGFNFLGSLGILNVIKPTERSYVQDPILAGKAFLILGITFCVIQSVLRIFSSKQEKLHHELILTGTKMVGTIERIALQKGMTFGKKSPFIIHYTYSYKDKNYRVKSDLLWEKPSLSKGSKIDIFVNDIGQSTIEL